MARSNFHQLRDAAKRRCNIPNQKEHKLKQLYALSLSRNLDNLVPASEAA